MLRRLLVVFILISTFAVAGCKISGTITTEAGDGVEGVTVYLKGKGEDEGTSIMAITLADGTYVFEGFHHGTLTITPDPESGKYTFDPVSKTMTVDFFQNVFDADFTAKELSSQLPSGQPSEPWSTYQGNASHTGYVPVPLNTTEFSESWTRNVFEIAGLDPDMLEGEALNPVAAGDEKVFITTGGDYGPHLAMALDSSDGRMLWISDFGNIDFISPPAYANGTVFIQSGVGLDSYLWAFDDEEENAKAEIFKTPYENQYFRYYAPTIDIDGDYVYMGGGEFEGGYGAGVYCFEGMLGGFDWYVHLGDLNTSDQWTPAVNGDYVITYNGLYKYDLYEDSKLTVINRVTPTEVFSIPDPNFKWNGTSLNLAPVLGSQDNVVVIQDGRLISFDLAEKKIGWQIPKDDQNVEGDEGDEEEKSGKHFNGQPSLANGFIYAVYKGYLHERIESDGSFVWEWQPPSGESIVAPMLVTDNLIFVSTESTTYAVDLESQTEVWSYDAGGHLALSNDGILFIATTEGELHAISTIAVEEF